MKVLAFSKTGVREANAHSIVVKDDSGVAVVIVQQRGEMLELLTPTHQNFNRTLSLLESAARVQLQQPTSVHVEQVK